MADYFLNVCMIAGWVGFVAMVITYVLTDHSLENPHPNFKIRVQVITIAAFLLTLSVAFTFAGYKVGRRTAPQLRATSPTACPMGDAIP